MSKAVVKADKEADRKVAVSPVRHVPYGVRRRLNTEAHTVVVEKIVERVVEKIVEVEKKAENSTSSDAGKQVPASSPAKGRKGKAKETIESPAAQAAENTADPGGSIEEKASAPITGDV